MLVGQGKGASLSAPHGLALGLVLEMGVSENEGYLVLGSVESGSYYLGYYIRVPYFRKLPNECDKI